MATGLATSTIYKVENGKVSPSFENLLRLARGYGVGLEKLIESPAEEVNTTRLTVTRLGEGRAVHGKTYNYEVLCNGLTGKKSSLLSHQSARVGRWIKTNWTSTMGKSCFLF